MSEKLAQFDPEITAAIRKETERQEYSLEFIASENFVSEAVLEAQGSVLTNKYAEGYPAKRYYGGCEFVDVAEQLAIDRAKELLRTTNIPCAQVAHQSGYNDSHYFSTFFKKKTGLTPLQFRRRSQTHKS